ncbi:TIR domain-containing protein [Acidovorax sp. BLS4]|uniref:TIR domain-containing protein n=1 Tax=Acidovorax sp. BLS4 TaxID=3273430 RepID=UPI002943D249|nr:TIR domain-containing protein [Paracidovorax avenae]WOI45140.1 TIR domain-containing protein [Paracidovorax avenae]
MTLKVFISYAKEDANYANELYARLENEGASPWLDTKKLLPGQNWDFEIDRALKDANVVVLLLSPRSVGKRGFVQREAHDAVELLRYKKEGDIYILPLLIEPCEVPSFIAGKLQYIDMTTADAYSRVQEALKIAADQQKIELQRGTVAGLLRVFTESISDEQEGNPGYKVTVEYPRFASVQNPSAAQELSMFFSGRSARALIRWRSNQWNQDPELYRNDDWYEPKNNLWDGFGIAFANEKFLSLTCNIATYHAGAAHGNSDFQTFNFALTDRLQLLEIEDFFTDPSLALPVVSQVCVRQLCKEYWEREGHQPDQNQMDWFASGAGPSWVNFRSFNLKTDGFTVLFPPYQVSGYALGPWSVDLTFYDLREYLKPKGPHTLARAL